MIDGAHLAAFLSAALVLAALPGPGMLYVLARSLGDGRRAGVRSALGTAIGGLCHVVGTALGLSALLMTSATAFAVVRYAGAAYLVVLGLRTLTDRAAPERVTGASGAFRRGVLTELLNPKTALFFLTFLPQFVQPARGPALPQLLALGCASVALNSSADVVVAFAAGRLGARLRRNPGWWRRQRAAAGCALIALGGYAALADRR